MTESNRNALEQALRAFEPVFWAGPWGEPLERLYEPDGTLYAICLDGPVDLATDRRSVTVDRGDLIVIPPAVAVELSAQARWFGIVYTGPYPYHFRERFIQVWGFEHIASGFERPGHGEAAAPSESQAEVRPRDHRHRIHPTFAPERSHDSTTGPEFRISIDLEPGSPPGFRVAWSDPGASSPLFDSPPASGQRIELAIPTEGVYLAHREARPAPAAAQPMTPEYRPGEDRASS